MLSLPEKLLFILLAVTAVVMAWQPFRKMFAIIERGQGPDKLAFDQAVRRTVTAISNLFSQGRIWRNRPISSLIHLGIAWGFLFFLIVNGLDTLEGFLPEKWHLWNATHNLWWGNSYRFLADLFTLTVLTGVLYFLLRRFLFRDPELSIRPNIMLHPKARAGGIRRDSLIVGLFILVHISARLLAATSTITLHGPDQWQPIANTIANTFLSNASPFTLSLLWRVGWWVGLGAILLFLPYFPYTKHAHLFMGPLNFATRPERGALGALNAISFEDENNEKYGVTTTLDLSATQLLDPFACIMCNRCQSACPAYQTGKSLSPAAIEINKRYFLWDNFEALAKGEEDSTPFLSYALDESALWACTSCGACSAVCPVGNEPMMDIMEVRRAQVLMEDRYPHALKNAFQGLERRGNPWGATHSRLNWAQELPFAVPTVDENPDFEYLFWVGCAGAFDPSAQKVARAVATILHSADISFAVLGDQEQCTGDPARRAGHEYLFAELAQQNIATFDQYQLQQRKIVTSCPHCFTTLGVEYKQYGGNYQVYHHTQLIADLVGRNKLKLNQGKLEHITFHDPCFLGRHNGVYDDPRSALEAAGMTLLEMENHHENSFCCGAGGAQVWKEEEPGTAAVNVTRYQEAEKTGATTIAVGCPFCAVMLNEAKGKRGDKLAVKDVAQIVAERIASP